MKNRNILLLFSLLVLSLLVVSGAGTAVYAQTDDSSQQDDSSAQTDDSGQPTAAPAVQTGTVYDVIAADPRLSSFQALVDAAALADNLDQAGPFTVFAPTNEAWAAFEAMNAANAADSEDSDSSATEATLTQILLYHILNGNYSANSVTSRGSIPSLLGDSISFTATDSGTSLNGDAQIAGGAVQASNGVVYVIDTVLMPSVHSLATSNLGSPTQTIAQVLENDGRFGIFLMLLEQASLLDELENPNADYTLFAPTDEAFNAVPADVRDEWLAPGNSQFVGIMAYHLVTDKLGINQIATDELIPTLEGHPLFVTTDDRLGVYLNGTPISEFNIAASNGVIHVVDSVLMP